MTAIDYNIIHQAAESVFMVFDDTIDNKAYCNFVGNFLVLALLWKTDKETTNSDLANMCVLFLVTNFLCQGLQNRQKKEEQEQDNHSSSSNSNTHTHTPTYPTSI